MSEGIKINFKYSFMDEIETEKDLVKFAKKIADLYRKTYEYAKWSKSKLAGRNECELCGVEFKEDVIKPNVHHDPFTLTEIVIKVIDELESDDIPINTFTVLLKLHILHEENKVEYKVLCECCHKRLHAERKVRSKLS